jgi:putative transposase
MDNHYHGIVQTPDANLSQAMQWFHGAYAAWYNARHNRVGPLFQGRYRAIPVENGGWAYALSLYVHLNLLRIAGLGLDRQGRVLEGKGFRTPTKAEVTRRLRQLRQLGWSSYRAYAGYAAAPQWLETEELLRRAHSRPECRRRQYRADARQRLSVGVEPSQIERLRDAVAVGSAAFAARMRAVPDLAKLHGIAGKRELRRRLSIAEVRAAVARLKGQEWDSFVDRRGDWGRPLFLWAARRFCGLTLREMGVAVGGMNSAAVSTALKRFERRAVEAKDLKALQSRMVAMLIVEP